MSRPLPAPRAGPRRAAPDEPRAAGGPVAPGLGHRGGRLLDPPRRHGRVLRLRGARPPAAAARPPGRSSAARSARVVLAATYEARAFGVHSAMPMATARRMCPQAIVVPPDMAAYREVSAAVMDALARRHHARRADQRRRGLPRRVAARAAGSGRRRGSPRSSGERVHAEHGITCSVGIARTKFVAKLASGHAKPDGVLLVPRGRDRRLPAHAAGRRALGGRGADRGGPGALGRRGRSPSSPTATCATIQRAVGKVAGAHLHDLSWGRDPRPVEPGPGREEHRRRGDVPAGRRGPRRRPDAGPRRSRTAAPSGCARSRSWPGR